MKLADIILQDQTENPISRRRGLVLMNDPPEGMRYMECWRNRKTFELTPKRMNEDDWLQHIGFEARHEPRIWDYVAEYNAWLDGLMLGVMLNLGLINSPSPEALFHDLSRL